MAVAVRPSPTFLDWVRNDAEPLTWRHLATHLGRQMGNDRTRRPPASSDPSPCSAPFPPDGIPVPTPPNRSSTRDQACQISPPRKLIQDAACQSGCSIMVDSGASPDLTHLGVSLVPIRPVTSYLPPGRRFVLTRSKILMRFRMFVWAMPTPPEIETPAEQSHPESTREVNGPPLFYPIPPQLMEQLTRPPRTRHPPFPVEDFPPPPAVDLWYIPVPPGIRAGYTTEAMLLRSQPEMNRPRRRIPPRPARVLPATIPTSPQRMS